MNDILNNIIEIEAKAKAIVKEANEREEKKESDIFNIEKSLEDGANQRLSRAVAEITKETEKDTAVLRSDIEREREKTISRLRKSFSDIKTAWIDEIYNAVIY